jgi:NitT/TauT family transport system substrate-binding protein
VSGPRPRPRLVRRPFLAVVIGLSLLVAACSGSGGSAAPSSSPAASAGASPAASASPSSAVATKLVVGLGYIPSVQFAPFYLADQAGYYEAAGLDVEFQNKIDPDLITLVGQGSIDVGIADGTSVIPAVSQGIPIKYVATIYGQFPSIVFSKSSAGIDTAAKLKGQKLGIPGKYGSSWIMLQALLASVQLTPSDLTIVEYPDFGQGAAVAAGAVDAATGFANNEPVQLELQGEDVNVLHVDDVTPLPGPGLIAGAKTLESKGDAVKAFVAATIKAMEDVQATPTKGLDAAIVAVPDLAANREAQAAILDATIASWTGTAQTAGGLGALDHEGWAASITYLSTLKTTEGVALVPNAVTVQDVLAEGYVPGP